MPQRSRRPLLPLSFSACALLVSYASFAAPAPADDSPVITLHHTVRPPYEYYVNGVPTGIVAEPIADAFRKAGVPFKWAETPVARQFHVIKLNAGMDCLAGRFKNAERETWAQYTTRPAYRDLAQGLLARTDNARVKGQPSMATVLQDNDNRILVKLANSYGPTIDAWLAKRQRPTTVTADESTDMLRRIHRGQADVMIIAEEEAAGLLQSAGLPPGELEFLRFADAPPGEYRYIMCSKQVPASVIEKLDRAIKPLAR